MTEERLGKLYTFSKLDMSINFVDFKISDECIILSHTFKTRRTFLGDLKIKEVKLQFMSHAKGISLSFFSESPWKVYTPKSVREISNPPDILSLMHLDVVLVSFFLSCQV